MTATTTQALITRGVVEKRCFFSESPAGDPFGVVVVRDASGATHPALGCGKEFPLDFISLTVGHEVRLTPTEKGLRLSPWAQQPDELQEAVIARMEAGETLAEESHAPFVEPPEAPSSDPLATVVPHLHELISAAGKAAQEHGMACGGWLFLPLVD